MDKKRLQELAGIEQLNEATGKIFYSHEDELSSLLNRLVGDKPGKYNGKAPTYILYSIEDEAFFVSLSPFSVEDIKAQYPKAELDITGTAER